MASHPLNYEPYPEVNPAGGPEARQTIHADPDMFGAAIGRGVEKLGQGIEHADNAVFGVAEMQAHQDAQTHANELHSWQSDQVTNLQEGFLKLKGKDAELALPTFKQKIDDIHQQARDQAGNPVTAQLVDSEGRRLTDAAYAQSARHAAQEKSTWDLRTATDGAASSGSRAGLAATITPPDVPLNANPSVVLELARSDDLARQAAQHAGLDGDIEVQRNRSKNVGGIIKDLIADGSQTSLTRAWAFLGSQDNRIDPASRGAIEQALHAQTAKFNGQTRADAYMGRGPAMPPGYYGATIRIESGGQPGQVTGSNKGLAQFSPDLERRYGLNATNRDDPAAVARALALENAENHDALARALGHEPTPADYYLAHQQGAGGAIAHISQPNLPAWQNIYSTGEGQQKGMGWAKQAIWGNMTPAMKAQFPGGVDTVSSSDFARMWAQRFYSQPIQAAGIIPGNGTQMPPGQGGFQPAAMTFDRFGSAQNFGLQNKGEVLKQINEDPFLRDHPQAMADAITHTNKVFEAQSANYADMERQIHIQEQQKKMASEAAENDYLKQIYTPAANAKPIGVADIVNNDLLSRESKDRLIKLVGHSEEHDAKSYGSGFVHALQMVHAPPGTEGRLSDPQQLYSRLGPDGDLTYAGVEKLRSEIALKKSPEGEAESAMKKTLLDFAKGQLTGADPILHIKDSHGDEQLLKFQAEFWPAYDKGRAKGLTPTQMLNPDSPDYLGKSIHQFKRSNAQLVADLTADNPDMQTAQQPGKGSPFDLNKVSSLDQLKQAVNDGKITPAQARSYGITKQWLGQKTQPAAPAAPVSQ